MDRVFDTIVPTIPPTIYGMFKGEPVTWSPHVAGNLINKDHKMVFGLRVGPALSVSAVLHEMAHFIEIDDDRCHLSGWGLILPRDEGGFPEPKTYQASEREIRVFAIQKVLAAHVGVNFNANSYAKAFSFMPDWALWNLRYNDHEATFGSRFRTIAHNIRAQSAAISLRDILREWKRKCGISRERLPHTPPSPQKIPRPRKKK